MNQKVSTFFFDSFREKTKKEKIKLTTPVVSCLFLICKHRAAENIGFFVSEDRCFQLKKNVLTSTIAFVGIALSRYFDLSQTDGITVIIISLFAFTMVCPIIKEASTCFTRLFPVSRNHSGNREHRQQHITGKRSSQHSI